jgi:hypothetical protein
MDHPPQKTVWDKKENAEHASPERTLSLETQGNQ